MLDLEGSSRAIRGYKLLPESLCRPAGIALPLLEISISIGLLVGWRPLAFALAGTALLFTFLVAQASVLIRGMEVGCGCFSSGHDADKIGLFTLARTAAFSIPLVAILLLARAGTPPASDLHGGFAPLEHLVVVNALLFLFSARQIFGNARLLHR